MRRFIIIASLAGSFLIFALTIDLFDAIFMFVFFGVLPFKATPIPATEMLAIYSLAGVAVVAYALRNRLSALVRSMHRKTTANAS